MKAVKMIPEQFNNWSKNMVRYGLKANLGQIMMNDIETSYIYQLGNFLFPAGQVDEAFWREYSSQCGLADKIIISQDVSWQDFFAGSA